MIRLLLPLLLFLMIYLWIIAIREILYEPLDPVVKILLIMFVIAFNGVGLLVYFLLLRGNLTRWFSK